MCAFIIGRKLHPFSALSTGRARFGPGALPCPVFKRSSSASARPFAKKAVRPCRVSGRSPTSCPKSSRAAFDYAHRKLPGPDLRVALADCAAVETNEFERRIGELISELATTHSVPKRELADYLRGVPAHRAPGLRRPSDPHGRTRRKNSLSTRRKSSRFSCRRGFRGSSPATSPRASTAGRSPSCAASASAPRCGSAEDPAQGRVTPRPRSSSSSTPRSRDRVKASTGLFSKVFELNAVAGVLPLRSVYLESDPPCLESPFVYGYDLAGLLFEWKWRYDSAEAGGGAEADSPAGGDRRRGARAGRRPPRPEAVSNVLLRPTEGGKFTMWVADFGWGQIQSVRSLELARVGPRGEQQRLASRGRRHRPLRLAAADRRRSRRPPPTTSTPSA